MDINFKYPFYIVLKYWPFTSIYGAHPLHLEQ